jgi:hypothetical protein
VIACRARRPNGAETYGSVCPLSPNRRLLALWTHLTRLENAAAGNRRSAPAGEGGAVGAHRGCRYRRLISDSCERRSHARPSPGPSPNITVARPLLTELLPLIPYAFHANSARNEARTANPMGMAQLISTTKLGHATVMLVRAADVRHSRYYYFCRECRPAALRRNPPSNGTSGAAEFLGAEWEGAAAPYKTSHTAVRNDAAWRCRHVTKGAAGSRFGRVVALGLLDLGPRPRPPAFLPLSGHIATAAKAGAAPVCETDGMASALLSAS